ncbi:MAG: nitroreductase family protein, partial [Faecalibacillus sp.]
NSQTPRYHVIKSKEMLKMFKETCLPEFNRKNCENAPVLVVSTFVKNRAGFERNGSPSNELQNGWGIYDTGLNNQNFILKATELGLGTLIMGIRDEKTIRSLLNIPENEMIISVIAVGYPDIDPEMPKRKSNEEIVKYY